MESRFFYFYQLPIVCGRLNTQRVISFRKFQPLQQRHTTQCNTKHINNWVIDIFSSNKWKRYFIAHPCTVYHTAARIPCYHSKSCWRIQFGNRDAVTCYTNTFTHIYNQLNRFTCIIKILDAHQHTRTRTRLLTNTHIHTCANANTNTRMHTRVCCVWELGRRQANCEACKDEVSLLRVHGACPSVGVYRNRKWNEYKNTFKHNSWFNTTESSCICVWVCMCAVV